MATIAKTVLDTVLARIDDPETLGVRDRDAARLLLDRLQEHVNFRLKLLTTTIALTRTATRTVYPLAEVADDCQRVLDVQYQGRSLSRQPWTTLGRVDGQWLRRTGSRPLLWCSFGLRNCIIYPARAAQNDVVDVLYVRRPTVLSSEDTVLDLRDDRLPFVKTLLEVVLNLRARAFPSTTALLQALPQSLRTQETIGGLRDEG